MKIEQVGTDRYGRMMSHRTAGARVLNVSEAGAQLHSRLQVRPGDTLRVVIASKEVLRTVVWADKGRFGVQFSPNLTADELEVVIR